MLDSDCQLHWLHLGFNTTKNQSKKYQFSSFGYPVDFHVFYWSRQEERIALLPSAPKWLARLIYSVLCFILRTVCIGHETSRALFWSWCTMSDTLLGGQYRNTDLPTMFFIGSGPLRFTLTKTSMYQQSFQNLRQKNHEITYNFQSGLPVMRVKAFVAVVS